MKHTNLQIANDFDLWNEYVAPGAPMKRVDFDALPLEEKMEIIWECFGRDDVKFVKVWIDVDGHVRTYADFDDETMEWEEGEPLVQSDAVNQFVYEQIRNDLMRGRKSGVILRDGKSFGWGVA